MKAFKTMGFKRGTGKRGFTLIELLIVMVILAILAGVVVMAVGGIFGQAKARAYDTIKPQIQNAVTAYTTANNGQLPPVLSGNTTYNITTEANQSVPTCRVFDICNIVGVGEILRQVPDGCMTQASGGIDNFPDANASCSATDTGQHYVWVMDPAGNVYSMCDDNGNGIISGGTETYDGFHGISTNYSADLWP